MKATRHFLALFALLPLTALAAENAKTELAAAQRAKPDREHGAELYAQCVSCHGGDGSGDTNGNIPRIAGQHYQVLLKQLVDFRHGKRWDFRMEEMADRHHLEGAQDIADVAAYVANLDRGGARGLGNGESIELGASLYGGRCQKCHGIRAEGDDAKAIPRLAGQHYSYLVRQMYDAVDGRRPSMLRGHSPRVAPLDFEEVRALADFLSRMPADELPASPAPSVSAGW